MATVQRLPAAIAAVMAAALLAVGAVAAPARPAPAAQPRAAAARHHDAYDIYRKYRRDSAEVPLRWGTKRFGYRHIRDRHDWSPELAAGIAVTLRAGEVVATSGTSQTYQYWQRDPSGKFETNVGWRVVVQWAKTRRDGEPKGIITAYEIARL
jgi:hypothetical protein